ncbi:MAG: ABC transporter substrate-binding protein [Candidatus Heimdallarchaeota archaeon]
MSQKYKKLFFVLTVIFCLLFGSVLQIKKSEAANPEPFFYISVLAPSTSSRNQWATLMVEQLPKIGIGIEIFDYTSWSQIYPRTWDYQGPYPIPCYSDGGFDILFVGWGWGLDIDPTGLFDTPSIVPNGDNFYQYSSQEMDWAISNYTSTYNSEDRIEYAENIQALLYDDLPQITIIYPQSLYPYTEEFSGWDGLLWASNYQSMENWSVGSGTDFHYGVPADFVDFHIYQYESSYDARWLHQIYNGLIERQPGTYDWGGCLATKITSFDGLTWVVDINPFALWADGTPLTAADVSYSYNLLIDPDFGARKFAYWEQFLDNSSVVIYNNHQVEITFKQPYVFQEGNLAVDLIPKHIWGSIAPEDQEAQAISWAFNDPSKIFGAGPYKLADFDDSNYIIHLEVNPYFDDWTGITPNFNDIYFEFYANKAGALSALSTGALDMVDAQFSPQLSEIAGLAGVTYELVDDPGAQEMGINMEHEYLGTGESCPIASAESAKHIRKAISHMVPRKIIVSEILDGIGREGVTAWCPAAFGYDDSLEPYEYNLRQARIEMRAAGFEYPEDNIETNSPTTFVLGFTLESIICSVIIIGSFPAIIKYKKRKKKIKKTKKG